MAQYFEVSEQSKSWLEQTETQEGMSIICGSVPTELLPSLKQMMIAHDDSKKPHGG